MDSFLDSLSGLWFRMLSVQPNPRPEIVLGTALVGLVMVCHRGIWRVLRNAVTLAHEGGHALVALCAGRKLSRIQLHSDTSGVTITRGRPDGLGMIATSLAGYLTPSLLGLLAAVMLSAGYLTGMLVFAVMLSLSMLARVRGTHGVVTVLVAAAVVLAVAWLAPVQAQAVFGYAFTWFLLFGGVRPVFELGRIRRCYGHVDTDADHLARLTGVSGGVWVAAFGLVNLVVLMIGVGVLIPRLTSAVASVRAELFS